MASNKPFVHTTAGQHVSNPQVKKSHDAGDRDPVLDYCNAHSTKPTPSQEKLTQMTLTLPYGHIMGAREVVNLNCLMIKALGARRVLDIGVLTGYSAMSAALVMPPDGKVVACDVSKECADFGRPVWKEAGVEDMIDLRIGPALDTLDALLADGQEGTFDFAFIDADKVNSLNYYERCLLLLRKGGIVSFDNTLWSCRVLDANIKDEGTMATRRLNDFLAKDDRVLVSMLPIGDGLTLVTRKQALQVVVSPFISESNEAQVSIRTQLLMDNHDTPRVRKSHHAGPADPILDYCVKHSTRPTQVQEKLTALTLTLPQGRMMGAKEVVNLNCLLMKALGARRVLDIGVFTGYSAMSAALALPPDGQVVACDVSKEWSDMGRPFWKEAGVEGKIDMRIGPAVDTLNALLAQGQEGSFDFAFIDADKENYQTYYECCLRLLRKGGIISFDNTFLRCRVMDPQVDDGIVVTMRQLNDFLANDERVIVSMLPIGDGLTLVTRK